MNRFRDLGCLTKARTTVEGFSLIEFVAILGVIGLLMAITIPAVMGVRARSERLQCANQLRQLALAVTLYADSHTALPVWAMGTSDECTARGEGVFTSLFPFVELPSKCDVLAQNQLRLPILICPADGDTAGIEAPLSYCANVSPGLGSGETSQGPFTTIVGLGHLRWRDISDGATQTAAFSEQVVRRRGGSEAAAELGGGRYFWSVVVPPISPAALANPGTAAALVERRNQTEISLTDCYGLYRQFSSRIDVDATDWRATNNITTTYSHWLQPNAPRCQAVGAAPDGPFLSGNFGAASAHQLGVNVAFLDGHVQFINDHVDERSWRAAGTRDGGESASLTAP